MHSQVYAGRKHVGGMNSAMLTAIPIIGGLHHPGLHFYGASVKRLAPLRKLELDSWILGLENKE